jgi:hypothetical protein
VTDMVVWLKASMGWPGLSDAARTNACKRNGKLTP